MLLLLVPLFARSGVGAVAGVMWLPMGGCLLALDLWAGGRVPPSELESLLRWMMSVGWMWCQKSSVGSWSAKLGRVCGLCGLWMLSW